MSSLQLLEPRHGRDVERREVAPQVAVVARHGDHRRVVGRELELRKERSPAAPAARFGDAVAQARVGRDAARDGDVADARLLRGADEFVEQNLDDGPLQRGAEVGLVRLDEVGVCGHGVAQRVEERGFQARERIVVALDAGLFTRSVNSRN